MLHAAFPLHLGEVTIVSPSHPVEVLSKLLSKLIVVMCVKICSDTCVQSSFPTEASDIRLRFVYRSLDSRQRVWCRILEGQASGLSDR